MSTGDGGGGGASICLVPVLIHLHPTPWCSKCIQWCSWLIYRRAGSCRGWRNTELSLTGHPSHNRALAATRKTQPPGKLSHRETISKKNYLTGKTTYLTGTPSHRANYLTMPPISQQGTSCHQKNSTTRETRISGPIYKPVYDIYHRFTIIYNNNNNNNNNATLVAQVSTLVSEWVSRSYFQTSVASRLLRDCSPLIFHCLPLFTI